jgi:hypothetical protein
MNVTMINYESLLQIVLWVPIVLFFIVIHKGLLYDTTQEKHNLDYKGNHSISWRYGKFRFSIPVFIFDKTDNFEIEKCRSEYNKMSMIFWLTTILTAIIYNIK